MRTIGIILLIIGIIVLLLSVATDAIGIGSSPGFGTWQILGAIAGIVLAAVGAFLLRQKS
jgi:hypothetical protein